MWVFDKRVLRRIFGPNNKEVTKGCRKMHNEVLPSELFTKHYEANKLGSDGGGGGGVRGT
jgi:hypothetical protein